MANPILQMLNAKNQNQVNNKLNSVFALLAGNNAIDLYNEMLQTNPKFKKFVQDNSGKSIEDIAMEYDIDLDMIKRFL